MDSISAITAAPSRRESVMFYVWERCNKAWVEGDFATAKNLNRMFGTFDEMTDEEWLHAYDECESSDL